MLENDIMETVSTEVTSVWRRNDIEKSTCKTHRYFVDFESRIQIEISMSNRCHTFHVDSPFKIDVISTNFPRGISTSNRWRINEDVSIGFIPFILSEGNFINICFISMNSGLNTLSKYRYFYLSKNITSHTFLLVFRIVHSLQCILKDSF